MRLWTAILAGLQVMSGGTVLLELWDSRYVGLFVLAVAALQAGTVMYMRSNAPGYQAKHAEIEPEEL